MTVLTTAPPGPRRPLARLNGSHCWDCGVPVVATGCPVDFKRCPGARCPACGAGCDLQIGDLHWTQVDYDTVPLPGDNGVCADRVRDLAEEDRVLRAEEAANDDVYDETDDLDPEDDEDDE